MNDEASDPARRVLRIDSLAEYHDVAQALSLEPRARILKLLQHGPMNVTQLATALESPLATVIRNVQKLEAAGLVGSELRSGRRGAQRICALRYDRIVLDLFPREASGETTVVPIPVGQYVAYEATPPCGLVGGAGPIGVIDEVDAFQHPDARTARLLWFTTGYVEYHVPNPALEDADVTAVELVAELCSEFDGARADWPSGITLWIDDVEIGTWISPGDFGERPGRFTPAWWPPGSSQYGIRTAWRIGRQGSSINGVRLSDVTVDDLGVTGRPYLSVRIGVKADAENPHGVNIFGRGFGNFGDDPQLFIEHAIP